MSPDLLLDTTIGSLSKELMKARQDALVAATERGFSVFRWVIYSLSNNILYLEGRDTEKWIELAKIELVMDMRPEMPANKKVNVIYL